MLVVFAGDSIGDISGDSHVPSATSIVNQIVPIIAGRQPDRCAARERPASGVSGGSVRGGISRSSFRLNPVMSGPPKRNITSWIDLLWLSRTQRVTDQLLEITHHNHHFDAFPGGHKKSSE